MERIDSVGLGQAFRVIRSSEIGSDRRSVLSFFLTADVFVLPSLLEGLPIAILEAMALGLPTISTRINAIPEAIVNNETGILVGPNDPGALGKSLIGLLSDESYRTELGQRGREFILNKFDERITAETAVFAYEEAFRHPLARQA
jgi:glycosyltransferase involved in cell wall biosynthesis